MGGRVCFQQDLSTRKTSDGSGVEPRCPARATVVYGRALTRTDAYRNQAAYTNGYHLSFWPYPQTISAGDELCRLSCTAQGLQQWWMGRRHPTDLTAPRCSGHTGR